MNKLQKIQKALADPEYRISLLKTGDSDLQKLIDAAHSAIENIFESALADIGVDTIADMAHQKKANHQNCSA